MGKPGQGGNRESALAGECAGSGGISKFPRKL